MPIRLRLNLILIGALLLLGLLTTALSYQVETRRAKAEIDHEAALLIALATAARTYTTEDIKPLLGANDEGLFHPQTVPAFAAQKLFSLIRKDFPGFVYNEAVLNPTNRLDLANAWQTEVIKQFRDDSVVNSAESDILRGDKNLHFLAKPIKIVDPACLECHSTPEAAPTNMIKIYGNSNGFGWKLNEVVGAQFITVPAIASYQRARSSVIRYAFSMLAVFAVLIIAINLLLERALLAPLRRVTVAVDRLASGDVSDPDLSDVREDEIGALERGLRRIWRSFYVLTADASHNSDERRK